MEVEERDVSHRQEEAGECMGRVSGVTRKGRVWGVRDVQVWRRRVVVLEEGDGWRVRRDRDEGPFGRWGEKVQEWMGP